MRSLTAKNVGLICQPLCSDAAWSWLGRLAFATPTARGASCAAIGSRIAFKASFSRFVISLSNTSGRRRIGQRQVLCMAPAQALEVLVKAETGNAEKLGDCPFSQRVLLTLEEKGLPYEVKFVDTTNKPDWFLEANPEGKVPVIKHDGKWISDSDVITQFLEETYPEPSLSTPADKTSVGSKIFPSFVKFLKSTDPNDGTKEALMEELKLLNNHLQAHGPYVNGDKVSAVDLSLAPKLYHLKIALAHYKNYEIPEELAELQSYIQGLHARESFEKTKASEDAVVKGWQRHFNL